jgi:hypothetical protein
MISYWAVNSSNALTMRFTWIGKPNTDKGSQIPCVFDGYWGEYDEMVVQNDGTATPTFWRFGTDSTKQACSIPANHDWAPSIVQHVSGFSLPPL